MEKKRLFIFLEGTDDVRFFEHVVRPRFLHAYASVELVTYACMKSIKVDRFIRGITAMNNDYIIVADIDQEPGVAAKKKVIMSRFIEADYNRIMVIIMEIESWYVAGLDRTAAMDLGLRDHETTDFVTKEVFNRWVPPKYPSRIAFMIDILTRFSLTVAKKKNKSFGYFLKHFLIANPDEAEPVNLKSLSAIDDHADR
ncbi:MAG TPA: hypothetical protein VMC42_09625 [Methanoregulaceae archaeon]|nr:hypothetical protein [Methanoregulaceae archaeon]